MNLRQRKLALILKQYWDRENKPPTTHYLATKVDACDTKVCDDLAFIAKLGFVTCSKRAYTRKTPMGNQNSTVLEAQPTPVLVELLPRIEEVVAMDEVVNGETPQADQKEV